MKIKLFDNSNWLLFHMDFRQSLSCNFGNLRNCADNSTAWNAKKTLFLANFMQVKADLVDNAKTYFAVSEAIEFQIRYVMLSGQIDFNKSA